MCIVQIIHIIHIIIIIILGISPFIPNKKIKECSFTFLIFLLFQYLTKYKRCGLTSLEYMIIGKKYEKGFMYRLITPIITIPESYFNEYIFYIHILYIIILYNQIKNKII